jgi:hypothetical protein
MVEIYQFEDSDLLLMAKVEEDAQVLVSIIP